MAGYNGLLDFPRFADGHILILHLNGRVDHRPLIQFHPRGSHKTTPKGIPHVWEDRIPIAIRTLGDIKYCESTINRQNVSGGTKCLQGQILEYTYERTVGHGR